jgi:sulfide:quinone oxidoreductase
MLENGAGKTRVLIAGGGVAALEATLALDRLAREVVSITLLAPDPQFRHRPLSVTEPFGLAEPRPLDLAGFASAHGCEFICDSLARVDPAERRAGTASGEELAYDELLIAIGARAGTSIPGALAFWDTADRGALADVVSELEAGRVRRIAFAVAGELSWPLGLYELAMLTAHRVRERRLGDVEVALVTPEASPLAIFGEEASGVVSTLLEQAGVEVRTGADPVRFDAGELALRSGERIRCDRVISLPIPEVVRIPGLPQETGGFVHADRFGAVLGVDHVYAAGDATTFPIKQGGLAAQQADAAARSIAGAAGAPVQPLPFRPVLRGALLTEWGPRYLRTVLDEHSSAAARSMLWWPPAKVAGKYLAPFLAAEAGYDEGGVELDDLEPPSGDRPGETDTGREDVVALALESAESRAGRGDFRGALRWLEVAEDLEAYLPAPYEDSRRTWSAHAAPRAVAPPRPGPG